MNTPAQQLGRSFFYYIRVTLLLVVLIAVAAGTLLKERKFGEWNRNMTVVLVPVDLTTNAAVTRHIQRLESSDFDDLEHYINQEALKYGMPEHTSVDIVLARPINDAPPLPQPGSALDTALWSLKFRWWNWRYSGREGASPGDMHLYLIYYDPEVYSSLDHSGALAKTASGFVKVFANNKLHESNLVVITHEMLHVFGASDKYDLATLAPLYPGGYAEPDAKPRYPQHRAEIMAGRKPISPSDWEPAFALSETVIGPETAKEIGWIKSP